MRLPIVVAAIAISCLTVGCPIPPSGAAKAQDAAQELNLNARFGRMEMAVDHVAAKQRETWMQTHKLWGGKIRVADFEMAGIKTPKEGEAEVIVRIAWYRSDEQELRSTTLKQKWADVNGEFMLVGESRLDGDVGLLGEKADKPKPADPNAPPHEPARFPTIRIGGGDDDNGATYRPGT